VLGIPPAFILSQDQTLHKNEFMKMLVALSLFFFLFCVILYGNKSPHS
jgi:hypothetical protein